MLNGDIRNDITLTVRVDYLSIHYALSLILSVSVFLPLIFPCWWILFVTRFIMLVLRRYLFSLPLLFYSLFSLTYLSPFCVFIFFFLVISLVLIFHSFLFLSSLPTLMSSFLSFYSISPFFLVLFSPFSLFFLFLSSRTPFILFYFCLPSFLQTFISHFLRFSILLPFL